MDGKDGDNTVCTSKERLYQQAIEHHEKLSKIAKENGDRAGEGRAYGGLGIIYNSLGDYQKAIKYHEKYLKIAKEIDDQAGEGAAYSKLGIAYHSLGDYQKAIEYHEKHLKIAIEIGDRAGEGGAYGNLGIEYKSLCDYQKALEYQEKDLKIAKEIGDRAGEGRASGNLASAYLSIGDYKKGIDYNKKLLEIAKEIGDRAGEGRAYGNLGNAYHLLGDCKKAIEYHEKHLKIAKEIGDRAGEGRAYGNFGNAYHLLGDYKRAIEYHEKDLEIAIEIGDQAGEGAGYGNLGNAYQSLSDYQKAIEYYEKDLKIAKEIGNRVGEGQAYGSLGVAYNLLGDYQKGIKYLKKHLKNAEEIGDRGGKGRGHGNLGNGYSMLGDYQKAINNYEKRLKIAKEIGDRAGEGSGYGQLGSAYDSLGDYQKAIEYHEKCLKIAKEIGDRAGEGGAYGNLGNAYQSLGYYEKAIEYDENFLKIAKRIGDRRGEGHAYHKIGLGLFFLEQFKDAADNFRCALGAFSTVRSCLKSKDDWKINFRELYETTYTGLWNSLLRIEKLDEALLAAEQGRAQTLADNLLIQYKLPASLLAATIDLKDMVSLFFTELSSPTLFLAVDGLTINIWLLSRGKKVIFRQGTLEGDRRETDPVRALLQNCLEKIRTEVSIGCEDRTLDEIPLDCQSSIDELKKPVQSLENHFKAFYDGIIGPIVDVLELEDNELVIVPDGALSFTPWAAVIESIRIRTVPSLTTYKLILSIPDDHHKKTGALLVGNPCLKELKKPLDDLPCAQEEVEMIASILNTRPLTGRRATKAEVMKRMSSVGLIHIAAHGNERTGEIALCPNPGWTSKFPQKKDFMLTMSDVQAANLRARLVVLSCCHSGRGRISKGEGVVGIARAFLAAGARSVLVTLWAIDDEATMVFMKSFYQHLKEGKTASAAIHQSMKSFRESEKFSEVRYWAPFQLIGDDVKIEFEADDDVKE